MSIPLIVATRSPLPAHQAPWHFELAWDPDDSDDDDDDDDNPLDEGSFELAEVIDDEAFVAAVAAAVGFAPASIVQIAPAGWDMSTIAAEVIVKAFGGAFYAALDGPPRIERKARRPSTSPTSLAAIEALIVAARDAPRPFFRRWSKAAAEAQAAHDREHPAAAAARGADNDWSDV